MPVLEDRLGREAGLREPFRVAVISDLAEEGWHSMDLVAEMLSGQLATQHAGECSVRQIRAPFRRVLSDLPGGAARRLGYNFDRLVNRHVVYPAFLKRARRDFDLFHIVDHSYAHLAMRLPAERTIVTCHDLDAFRCVLMPEAEPRPRWFRYLVDQILHGMQRAAHVFFVSHTVREQALALGLLRRERTSVAANGVDPVFCSKPDRVADKQISRLLPAGQTGPLLLHVGSTIPRKRIDVLLDTFAAVRSALPGARLMRVGGPFTESQREQAAQLGVSSAIVELPFLSREALAAVYRRAAVLLQPSEAEGFGLPVVEAMACGCPVIASDLTVLREVGGTAGTYCPVGNIQAWSQSVLNLIQLRAQAGREWQEMQDAMKTQTAGYSWQNTAREAVAVYRRTLAVLL